MFGTSANFWADPFQLLLAQHQHQHHNQHIDQQHLQSIARPFACGMPTLRADVPVCSHTQVEEKPSAGFPAPRCPLPPPPPVKQRDQQTSFLAFVLQKFDTCADDEDACEFADNIIALVKEHKMSKSLLRAFMNSLSDADIVDHVVAQARDNKTFSEAFVALQLI